MHPWHDVPVDAGQLATRLPVVVEIPRGGKNKYELDKQTGILRLDRVLHSAVHYPANYGFVPRTLADDGDPLDVLVLMQEPVPPLTLVFARPIGMFKMRDEAGVDDKIVAVCIDDPAYADYTEQSQLPRHVLAEMLRFFQDYKQLEGKQVVVDRLQPAAAALPILERALQAYAALRLKPGTSPAPA
jgi:inorganic pyrophosphatase